MRSDTRAELARLYPRRQSEHLAAYIRVVGVNPDALGKTALSALAKAADAHMAELGDRAEQEARTLSASYALLDSHTGGTAERDLALLSVLGN